MNRKKKQIMILLGILLLLLLAWFAMEKRNRNQKARQEAKEREEAVYVTDLSEVCEISYDVGNGEMTFEKQGEGWVYKQDPDFPLAQSYPEQAVSFYTKLRAERELKDGDAPEAYGLTDSSYFVHLTETDGGEVRLMFGDAVNDGYYMQKENTGQIYTVGSEAMQELQYTLEEMAELDIYPNIGSGNLKKEVIIQRGKTTVYDAENEDDELNIASVAGGLGAVSLSAAADYSVEEGDLKDYGLDEESRITVEATYTEGEEEKTLTLYIGGEGEEGSRYVMINASRIVYLVPSAVCDNILNVEADVS